MSPAEAKKWIIPAVTVAGITAAVSDITDKRQVPRIRIAIGAVLVAAILSFGADFAPEIVSGLAATILVGALLLKGGIFSKIAGILA
jgi:hypothetical protein